MAERWYCVLARDVLTATGPEAGSFLQGQLSQDVLSLDPGRSSWSWLLAPNGKVEALLRVGRLDEGFVLDTDAGWGEAVLSRLQRFRLRTKVDLVAESEAAVVAFRGIEPPGSGDFAFSPPWPGVDGADVVFRGEVSLPPAGDEPGAAQYGAEQYEAERIRLGIPRMGAELTERTIPGETGLVADTVSFTKGCYTGQELVARIDSRGGNVPRHLRRLVSDAPISAGDELFDGDTAAGSVTSAAKAPGGGWVALGYVRRGFEPPLTLQVGAGGPAVEVRA